MLHVVHSGQHIHNIYVYIYIYMYIDSLVVLFSTPPCSSPLFAGVPVLLE